MILWCPRVHRVWRSRDTAFQSSHTVDYKPLKIWRELRKVSWRLCYIQNSFVPYLTCLYWGADCAAHDMNITTSDRWLTLISSLWSWYHSHKTLTSFLLGLNPWWFVFSSPSAGAGVVSRRVSWPGDTVQLAPYSPVYLWTRLSVSVYLPAVLASAWPGCWPLCWPLCWPAWCWARPPPPGLPPSSTSRSEAPGPPIVSPQPGQSSRNSSHSCESCEAHSQKINKNTINMLPFTGLPEWHLQYLML